MNSFPMFMNGITYSTEQEYDQRVKSDLEQLTNLIMDMYKWEKTMEQHLKRQPEGFTFEANGRMCSVCLAGVAGEMWYDSLGMRCLDCQSAYECKIIPKYVIKGDRNRTYITDAHLSSESGMKSGQIKKCIKQGELKARTIKRRSYPDTFLFLKNENPSIAQYFTA